MGSASSRTPRPSRTRRVAISLPAALLRRVEQQRRETAESRSGFVKRALEDLLRRVEHERRVREYVEGYRRSPETAEEVSAADAAAVDALADEPWE
jgi:metal-responsive CopG/Arc/MetJ family transcriptional regulator